MNFNLYDLRLFAVVAQHASFRRAAAEFGLAPSSVSHTIRAMEETLGARLFNRTTRSVALTEAGGRFLSRIKPALVELDAAMSDMGVEEVTACMGLFLSKKI